jgi:hypothetical protein
MRITLLTGFCLSLMSCRAPQAFAELDPPDAYEAAVKKVTKLVSGRGFTVVEEAPFIVIGDESPAKVQSRARGTVRWASEKLKAGYFAKDPTDTITIWLFKDAKSYEANTWRFFKDRPSTPFGYYAPSDKAIIMDISTGGGTLVHEMVHPFMESNFPKCPAWFNEGLGSLYEQSSEREGKIWGLTNWRLSGLQQTIQGGKLPSFSTLMKTTSDQFYNHDPGSNYAQSRYLLYYLQGQGKLRAFYRTFYKNRKTDPTGYATLQAILGVSDMKAFQKKWEKFVLGLRF